MDFQEIDTAYLVSQSMFVIAYNVCTIYGSFTGVQKNIT